MLKYKMNCPKCGKRACDVGGVVQKVPVIVELKCPHCRNVVRIVCSGNN
ncbi:MAG: hypothetical protein K2J47_00190 [Ruminococcus sp.]|nr:hypothetical protein [Ruminococcus sp.]